MSNRSAISPGEWEVARAVWRLGQASVGAVYEEVSARKAIDYATVQTYLRRLESKGYLRSERDGRKKIYAPKVSAKRAIKESVGELLDRVFDGQPLALIQHLVDEQGITPADTKQLRLLVDRLSKEAPE